MCPSSGWWAYAIITKIKWHKMAPNEGRPDTQHHIIMCIDSKASARQCVICEFYTCILNYTKHAILNTFILHIYIYILLEAIIPFFLSFITLCTEIKQKYFRTNILMLHDARAYWTTICDWFGRYFPPLYPDPVLRKWWQWRKW